MKTKTQRIGRLYDVHGREFSDDGEKEDKENVQSNSKKNVGVYKFYQKNDIETIWRIHVDEIFALESFVTIEDYERKGAETCKRLNSVPTTNERN